MWEELNLKVKSLDVYKTYKGVGKISLGLGPKNAKIMLIINNIEDGILDKKSILDTPELEMMKKILSTVQISIDDVYVTSLYKLDRNNLNRNIKNVNDLLDILFTEMTLVSPMYIISMGKEVFNMLVSEQLGLSLKTENTNIFDSVGKMYSYKGMVLIPMYDVDDIKKLNRNQKQEIVEMLKKIKE